MDPDELTRALAADPQNATDPTAWFDQLYIAAGSGDAEVPWDRRTPNVLLVEWMVGGEDVPAVTTSTMVVGAGYGRDAEYLASLGYSVTAFDVSSAAVEQTRARFPESTVEYAVGDLLDLPDGWLGSFGFVVESLTVQALPEPQRSAAVRGVASLVAPGGTLLVLAAGHDGPSGSRDALDTPPWPLLREEVEAFGTGGLEVVGIERVILDADPDTPRWRGVFRRP